MGLRRPQRTPITSTLWKDSDIGFPAGMIIADGTIGEPLIHSGGSRAKLDGDSPRIARCYSMPVVRVSMEDKASLRRLSRMWGTRVTFCQKSSTLNDVWQVAATGKRAYDLLRLVLPHLAGIKRKKALYILKKYKDRKSIPVKDPKSFRSFGDMK